MDPFLGEIRLFAGAYAPQDWALCDGTLYRIADYQTLYALIGTSYGGDGVTTFAVPDLRGRLPVGAGAGTGLTPRVLGQTGGYETVTLSVGQTPPHTHTMYATTANATTPSATNGLFAKVDQGSLFYVDGSKPATGVSTYSARSLSVAGGNQAHENRMPSMVMNYIISMTGFFPQQG